MKRKTKGKWEAKSLLLSQTDRESHDIRDPQVIRFVLCAFVVWLDVLGGNWTFLRPLQNLGLGFFCCLLDMYQLSQLFLVRLTSDTQSVIIMSINYVPRGRQKCRAQTASKMDRFELYLHVINFCLCRCFFCHRDKFFSFRKSPLISFSTWASTWQNSPLTRLFMISTVKFMTCKQTLDSR